MAEAMIQPDGLWSNWVCRAPLGAHTGVGQAAEHVDQGMSIAPVGEPFFGSGGQELGGELGQFRMRQPGVLMMHAVIRLVKQGERQESAEPALRHNAPRGAVHRAASEPDVLDVFTPALQVRGQNGRHQIHPQKISPCVPICDRGYDPEPQDDHQAKLSPNSPTHLLLANRRTGPQESAQE